METSALLQSLLLFSQVIPGIFILATPDCPASWCKTAGDCPEPKNACPSVTGCRTAVVKDKCGFCRVCLKAIGESCRRKPFKLQDDMCERGLVCKASDDEWYCANMAPENIKIGRCEKGLFTSCKSKVDPLKPLMAGHYCGICLSRWEIRNALLPNMSHLQFLNSVLTCHLYYELFVLGAHK